MATTLPSSAAGLARGLRARKFSSVEITRHFLAEIARLDPQLNSFINVCEELALTQAQTADDTLASGDAPPLCGVPYANKDIFCTQGVTTTCASKMLENFVAPYSATVVNRLASHGMVMLGKTNMDEFAMGSSNETSFFGATRNPWDHECVPGGSSGGSACAVAARLAPVATGTDTGGSIRQPAAFCGVSGLKPTYGRVSRYGMIAFASSLDQGGPIATTAEDLALVTNVIAGFDPLDSTSVQREAEDFSRFLGNDIAGMTFGCPKEFFDAGLEPAVGDQIDAAVMELEKLGATRREISLPTVPLSIPAYYVVSSAECSSNLARYDGVRFGHRCDEPSDLEELYCRSRGEGFGVEVKRRILVGTYALSAGYYDAYYRKAQQIRRLIKDDFQRVFAEVDLVVGPVAPTPAFKIGEKSSDPIQMYMSDIYTTAVNLAGLPGLAIPAGFVNGLPVGMHLIGNYFDEARMLQVAHAYQCATDWHLRSPVQES
jgi:aspartyl-tRNA(Asn)/glutamyl-tRNA(Gln) amidotransferase subunit A